MHLKGIFSLCGAIAAAVALVSASGATPAKNHTSAGIDVSSRAAIVHYLRGIHVNPKGLVIQRGQHNYAGARCPGKGWICTRTTHPVVQVARAGGGNRFACSAARCVVVQVAPAAARPNKGVCIKTTGLTQSCVITQSGGTDNMAVVYESARTISGLTQTASATASITQTATGTSNSNQACVYQEINIDGSTVKGRGTPVNVTLEAHQSVTITQHASGGSNLAQDSATSAGNCTTNPTLNPLTQAQTLTSTATGGGPITQNENAAQNGANVALDIEQNQPPTGSGTGANYAIFNQTSNLQAVANTAVGDVSQTQSSFTGDPQSPLNGGISAAVKQDSTGVETVHATQNETQCEDAATSGLTACSTTEHTNPFPDRLTQNQYGPVGNAGARRTGRYEPYQIKKHNGTQTGGNIGDVFTINQTSNQDSDTGSTQSNAVQGDCLTPGNCTVTQQTTVQGDSTTNVQSGQDVDTSTNCTGSNCNTCNGAQCTTGSANVLVAGTGDNGSTEPNNNLTQLLTSVGYSVTELATLPADLSSFGQVWWVDTNPPTTDEQNQLVAFAETGRGVFLTGEWSDGESGFAALDAADQSMVNSIVTAHGITLGGEGCCSGTPVAYPVNSGVVGNLATQPHTVTDWTPTLPGLIAGMAASSVFAHDPQAPMGVAAAAWNRSSTVGGGRLVVLMDINWAEADWRAANWSDVAENVAFFLSGLSSPPSPLVPAPNASATQALFGAPARSAPRSASSTASGGAGITR